VVVLDKPELMEHPELQDQPDLLALLVRQVHRDPEEMLVLTELQDQMGPQDQQVLEATQDPLVKPVLLGLQDSQVAWDLLGLQGQLEERDSLGHRELGVTLVSQELQGNPEILGPLASLEQLEVRDRQELGVRPGYLEILAR